MDTRRRGLIDPGSSQVAEGARPGAVRPIERRTAGGVLRRWGRTPPATVLLVAALWANVRTMPVGDTAWSMSAPTGPCDDATRVHVDRVPVDSLHPMGLGVRARTPGSPSGVGLAYYDFRRRSGVETHYVTITGTGFRPQEEAEVVRLYLEWLKQHPESYWRRIACEIQPGGASDSRSQDFWVGLRALLSLALGVLTVLSMAWILPVLAWVGQQVQRVSVDPEEHRRRRRRRLLASGLCPCCRYSIAGLPERRCPECNETWGSSELP